MIYGWIAAGVLGALTGCATAFLAGAGLQLAIRPSEPGLLPQPVMGLGLAVTAITGSIYGGWKWGWAWAMAAYFATMLLAMIVNIILVRSRTRR